MTFLKLNPAVPARILATDLDGTFIPLPEHPDNPAALDILRASRIEFIFATGRHFESAIAAMEYHDLPEPSWLICDVGTSIHHRVNGVFQRHAPFEQHLSDTTPGIERSAVVGLLADIEGLSLQSAEHQQRFKISYESETSQTEFIAGQINRRLSEAQMPYACLASHDPFHGRGLLDVLPAGASKAAAIFWLSTHANFLPDEVVFAGDSGNDFAALVCGFRAIVVGNAAPGLAESVEKELASRGLADRLYRATHPATSGVLQGLRHFGLLPDD